MVICRAGDNRRYAGQLDDFMKFTCQDCTRESFSAAVAQLFSLGITRAMKNTDIKFVTSQTLLIAGLVILSISGRWLFFTGLALVMI